jgi:hypothetical protein
MNIFVENLFRDQDCSKLAIPSFFVKSTAPPNVEDDSPNAQDVDQPTITDVVNLIYENSKGGAKELGVVIAIHGYNTGADLTPDGVREYWYKPLSQYINDDLFVQKKRNNLVFLGYRWPSESLKEKKLRKNALNALPVVLSALLYGGIFFTIVGLVLLALTHTTFPTLLIILSVISFSIILSLYLLRISVYFRDTYRATIFGVPDLVELIRQLDQGLIECKINEMLNDEALYERVKSKIPELQQLDEKLLAETLQSIRNELKKYPDLNVDPADAKFKRFCHRLTQQLPLQLDEEILLKVIERVSLLESLEYDAAQRYWTNNLIRISFIGHSMGGHVTTQVIRILSDVFDPRSVGKVGDNVEKNPSSRLGRVFRLSRLILVSPDIPLLTITSGRANFLRSALRRFEEAYLFSNEGDLALRIASTAANYFSFPARTRTQGYRLGNLSVSPKSSTTFKSKETASTYGILNLEELPNPDSHLLPYLEVNVLSKDRNQRLDPASQWQEIQENSETVATVQEDKEAIADLFTFFDCTEYKDWMEVEGKKKESYVLILDNQKSPLKLFGYLRLFIAFVRGKRDVHGGYFQGSFTKLLMYRLAFVGFQGLLDSLVLMSPEEFGIKKPLPDDLRADVTRLQDRYRADPASIATPSLPPYFLPPDQLASLQEKRRIALSYLSWLCAQRQIQVAVSPERYQADILGYNRSDVREVMLVEKAKGL